MQTKAKALLETIFTTKAKMKLAEALIIVRLMSSSHKSHKPPDLPFEGTIKLLATGNLLVRCIEENLEVWFQR